MPSKESEALVEFYRRIGGHMSSNMEVWLKPENMRILWESSHTVASEPEDVTYAEVKCPGTVGPAIWAIPVGAPKDAAILYTHGGGFTTGSPNSHRKLVGHLAKAVGIPALSIDYRMTPEHAYPTALDDTIAAYKWLTEEKGISPKRIATAGDSAGGNLAIASVLKARELGLPLPAAVVGFSPWLDMEVKGETLKTNAKTDPLNFPDGMKQMLEAYVAPTGTSLTDPLFNPLYADLKGYPPTYVTCGTHEGLQDNATDFAKRAKEADVDVTLEVAEGMQHVHPFMAGTAPEANETIARVGKFIKEKLSV